MKNEKAGPGEVSCFPERGLKRERNSRECLAPGPRRPVRVVIAISYHGDMVGVGPAIIVVGSLALGVAVNLNRLDQVRLGTMAVPLIIGLVRMMVVIVIVVVSITLIVRLIRVPAMT